MPSSVCDVHLLLADGVPGEAADAAQEVAGVGGALEADQVGSEQALDDVPAPGQLREDLQRREGNVVEEADLQVRAVLAQHLRDQLQLVVLDPHRGALGGHGGGGVGEPAVDGPVGVPPGAVELRRRNDVVIERPQGGVGEALVIQLHLGGAQRHRQQVHVVMVELVQLFVRSAVPAHPRAVGLGHHRRQRSDQPAGGAAPRFRRRRSSPGPRADGWRPR